MFWDTNWGFRPTTTPGIRHSITSCLRGEDRGWQERTESDFWFRAAKQAFETQQEQDTCKPELQVQELGFSKKRAFDYSKVYAINPRFGRTCWQKEQLPSPKEIKVCLPNRREENGKEWQELWCFWGPDKGVLPSVPSLCWNPSPVSFCAPLQTQSPVPCPPTVINQSLRSKLVFELYTYPLINPHSTSVR